MKKFVLILFCIFFIKETYANDNIFNQNVKNYNKNFTIFNRYGQIAAQFKVAIADDEEKMQTGLMNLKHLPKNHGMLFIFEKRGVANMWMKNTLIPLDMIFIDGNKIVAIFRDAKPLSLEIISSYKNVDKVLEINGGMAKKLNIRIGDVIEFLHVKSH
jgi:uncharacterized membrane protein (UPF0127 family)